VVCRLVDQHCPADLGHNPSPSPVKFFLTGHVKIG
jgi:hypothetical protein